MICNLASRQNVSLLGVGRPICLRPVQPDVRRLCFRVSPPKPFQDEQKTDSVIAWGVCRNDTLVPHGVERAADKKTKKTFRGNRTIFPERNYFKCV